LKGADVVVDCARSLAAALIRACSELPDVFLLSTAAPAAQQQSQVAAATGAQQAAQAPIDRHQDSSAAAVAMGEAAAAGAGAFPWEVAAIADPFADADGPGRAFRLSAAPEETLGLTRSGGTLRGSQHGHGSASAAAGGGSRPAGCRGAAAALAAQLAAASAEPCWPLHGGDASTTCGSGTENDAKASSMGSIEEASLQRNAAAAPPQPAQQLISAMASEPGAGTSFSKGLDDAAGDAANDAPPGSQQHAPEQQQRAEEAVPAAPGTPQRRGERPASLGSRHGSSAAPASAGSSPTKARRQPKIQPSAASTLRHDCAAPGSSPTQLRQGGEGEAATATLLRVQVEEARPAQTALLALQVHLPFCSVGKQDGQGDRECDQIVRECWAVPAANGKACMSRMQQEGSTEVW